MLSKPIEIALLDSRLKGSLEGGNRQIGAPRLSVLNPMRLALDRIARGQARAQPMLSSSSLSFEHVV